MSELGLILLMSGIAVLSGGATLCSIMYRYQKLSKNKEVKEASQ